MVEHKFAIVDTIETHLPSHVLNSHSLDWLHLLVTDWHDKGVNALIFSFNQSLCKNDGIVSVTSSVGNPILLR